MSDEKDNQTTTDTTTETAAESATADPVEHKSDQAMIYTLDAAVKKLHDAAPEAPNGGKNVI